MESKAVAVELAKATMSVLQTVAQLDSEAGVPYVKADSAALGDITAYVKVDGSGKQGSIAITFTKEVAVAVVRGMLGDDIGDIMQDAKDAVGEITNMVSGQLRAKLAEKGITLHGSTPNVTFGANTSVEHAAAPLVIPFKSKSGGTFVVEFCL